jgi:sugar phosphate isomerase/epimerase
MHQLAVSLYSFDPLLACGDVSAKAAMRFARSVGFAGIEMLDMYWRKDEPREAQADRLRAQAAEEAVDVACYTVHNNLALFDEAAWRSLVDRMLADVDLAARLGTRVMRVESSGGPPADRQGASFEECLAPVARGLKEVARRAADRGIAVGLENHGRFIATSQRVERVIDAVGEANLGACVDVGNFLIADEDPIAAVTRLASRAVHVHAKDMHLFETSQGKGSFATNGGKYLMGAVLGEGIVDVAGCIGILAKAGYRGWLSLEFEGRENTFYGIARGAANLADAARRQPLSF